MTKKYSVLDNGYVREIDSMGSDLSVVNAARASYDKEVKVLTHKDEKLINFLVREKHDSVLRHAGMTFEVYAPLMVARQWWKHAIGSTHSEEMVGWNESCLPVWQEVWSYGNKKYTVQDLLDGKNIPLRSVNSDGVIVPNRVKSIWSSGEQEVFTVTDEFGNKLSATGNHRVLTPSGYVLLADLKVGNEIGHSKRPAVFGFGKIVSIESAGVWETFDIEMELESNFVAGGVVVHNSRRYVTETPTFYIPDQFSTAPENSKQGAGDLMDFESSERWKTMLDSFYMRGYELYEQAMADGIAPEQARLFLPAYGLYVRWRWTASLNALLHFISLRLGHGAQNEIVEYGQVIASMVKNHFPVTTEAWIKHRV
jgi:thymidylate synthase ThyX